MSSKSLEAKGLRLVVAHINSVQQHMVNVITQLLTRMANHDQTKYLPDELDLVLGKPYLDTLEYNSDEYRDGLARVQHAIDVHYSSNSHHPEHFAEGIQDMSLLSLLEMACDWKAAADAHNSTYLESINRNVGRFGLSIEMQYILQNTGRELGWIKSGE